MDNGMENQESFVDYWNRLTLQEKTVYRTGKKYPNRKERRAARIHKEKVMYYTPQELRGVMKPFVKELISKGV